MSNQAVIMDKQREIAEKQSANLKRQLGDFETVQAADLVIEDFGLPYQTKTTDTGDVFVIDSTYTVRNVGSTVASEFTVQEEWHWGEHGVRIWRSESSLAGGKTHTYRLGRPVGGPDEIDKSDSVWVAVTLSYRDVFDHPHATVACLALNTTYKEFWSCPKRQ